jgi:WD40 repeat protein
LGGFGRDNRLWSLDPDEGSMDLNTGTDALAFAFRPDSRQLWMADSTGTIRLWDLERRAEIDRFSAHVGAAHSIRLLPDGRILSAGGDDALRVWQPRPSGIAQLEGYPHSLRTLAVSPDARWLATAGLHSEVFLWDLRDHRRAGLYPHPGAQSSAVAFGPDGSFATASADGLVRLWNTSAPDPIWIESLAPATNAWGLAFSPDGRRLYAASQRETVTILDPATGERLHTIGGLGNVVDGLAVSPDGRLLAVCNKIQLSVWLADGSRELWHAPANPNRSAAFSPDGQWIATGDQDGAISLWEVAAAGSVRRRLPGHAASVSGVSFSPDGRRLVSSSFDGQVKVWDWTAGAELLTLPLPAGGQAWHVVFTPDGKTIAAAGGDGLVTLWKTE